MNIIAETPFLVIGGEEPHKVAKSNTEGLISLLKQHNLLPSRVDGVKPEYHEIQNAMEFFNSQKEDLVVGYHGQITSSETVGGVHFLNYVVVSDSVDSLRDCENVIMDFLSERGYRESPRNCIIHDK